MPSLRSRLGWRCSVLGRLLLRHVGAVYFLGVLVFSGVGYSVTAELLSHLWAGWAAYPVSVVAACLLFLLLSRLSLLLPRPTLTLEARSAFWGQSPPGEALGWMVSFPACSERLTAYAAARLSPSELEVFSVLAQDSEVTLDELIEHVRSIGVSSADG